MMEIEKKVLDISYEEVYQSLRERFEKNGRKDLIKHLDEAYNEVHRNK